MNAKIYFLSITLLLAVCAGCKKEFDDTSFINNGISEPAKLSVLFNITQDNTGLVTIYPSGEGTTSYDVYYGDGAENFVKVGAGGNTQHAYKEGIYKVKIVAHGINGKTMELKQDVTVSFKAPENLKSAISTNGLTVKVGATADYETMFHVYYGDEKTVNPEPYDTFLESQTVTHTYAAAGSYVVRIVALSGGIATTTREETIKVGKQIDLPLTFDDPNFDYTTSDFGGNVSSVAVDPANAANKVLKVIKPGGAEVWSGTTLGTATGFANKVAVTAANSKMTARIYAPAAGLIVKLKLENQNVSANAVETDAVTTVANGWQTLTFDFNNNSPGTPALNPAFTYNKASMFFDFSVGGSGKVFYMDDLKMISAPSTVLGLPLDFESTTLDYTFTNFDGGTVTTVANPNASGVNTSSKVAKMVKNPGATYGGSFLALTNPIDFSTKKTFTMKVYSPRVGAKVLLKVENQTNGSIGFEKEVLTTKANQWEVLTFDYGAINTANSYQKIVLIFDNGTSGDGSANYTFYLDDITLN